MNKTINISIENKKFDLEEKANEILSQYFSSVQKYFSGHRNKEEILSDIENSIAEKFMAKLVANKDVITQKDVEDVIKSMGTPEDFQRFEEQNGENSIKGNLQDSTVAKKLYRDKDNKVLGGVALGLAVYFNIDVSFVRVFFVITTIFWGFGLILYLALWIILPEAKTAEQKEEMYGGKTALSSIEKKTSSQSLTEKLETQQRIRKALGIFIIVISSIFFIYSFSFLFFITRLGPPASALFSLFIYSLLLLPFLILMYLGRNLIIDKRISKLMIVLLILTSIFFCIFVLNVIVPAPMIFGWI